MIQRAIRNAVVFCTVVLGSVAVHAQSKKAPTDPYKWDAAQNAGVDRKLFVVTKEQPDRKQSCHVKAFSADEVVCSRAIGKPRTYRRDQILALIQPGEVNPLVLFFGFNAGLGASIWATVVLTATCPICAAATGIAALIFFDLAGLTMFTDTVPTQLLYLAPGENLSPKLGYIQQ